MVRTKGDNCAKKAVAAKAPRKALSTSAAGCSSSMSSPARSAKADKYAGGNPYCPRPTPSWQKEISAFFIPKAHETDPDKDDGQGFSSASIETRIKTEPLPSDDEN
ncbi:PCNA-associated factor-like [Limulus polyphemus]|uniref:PCNA-associated factor n=1 Tax=Limulus polyphemus TaxID=6850 RepID=A0ABM1T6G7_LIMPO|nr:PCNA-associated factor-like [Limulus polyphemus]XP_022251473.1 PCNA-associated factor-like [Limulus polyphemus]